MQVLTVPKQATGRNPVVYDLWYAPDGIHAAVLFGHDEGATRLVRLNVATGEVVERVNAVTDHEHGIAIPPPAFAADHALMTVGMAVRRPGERKRVLTLEGVRREDDPFLMLYGRTYDTLRFGPGGRAVFGIPNTKRAGDPWRIDRWDVGAAVAAGRKVARPVEGGSLYVHEEGFGGPVDLDVSPDGRYLAAIFYDARHVYRWRLDTNAPLPPVVLPRGTEGGGLVRFSPDGRTLLAAGQTVALFDPEGTTPRAALKTKPVRAAAFTPDGRRLLTASRRGRVRTWDVATGAAGPRYDWKPLVGPIAAVAVSPDGLTAVAAGTKRRLVRWDLSGG